MALRRLIKQAAQMARAFNNVHQIKWIN